MVSWKTLFLGLWSLLWGFVALSLLFAMLGTGVQTCSGGSVNGIKIEETCRTDWGPFVLMAVLTALALICLFFAVRFLLGSIRADRRRLSGHAH